MWRAGEISRLDWILNLLLGGGIGFAVGRLNRWATTSSVERPSVQIAGLTLVGMFLGWQAVLAVAAMTLGVWLIWRLSFARTAWGRAVTPAVCLLLATVAQLLLWSRFYG